MIRLHRKNDGEPVYLNPDFIIAITKSSASFDMGATFISFGDDDDYTVEESPEAVLKLIEQAEFRPFAVSTPGGPPNVFQNIMPDATPEEENDTVDDEDEGDYECIGDDNCLF